jgi:hypothetical protein
MLSVRPAPSSLIQRIALPAAQPLTRREAFPRLSAVSARPQDALTPRIELRSDEALPRDVQQRALSTAAAAYDNARRSLGYPVTASPLRLSLTSDAMAQGRGGFATLSANDVAASAVYFRRAPVDGFATYSLGRELGHVELNRAAPAGKVPGYVREGIAASLGTLFVQRQNVADKGVVTTAARHLQPLTGADARRMFDGGASPAASERLGSLFVEYLKTRVVGPHNFYPRVGAMLQRVGQGTDFDASFQKAMGVSLPEAQRSFIAFMGATQGNPAARLKGTVYQNHG